MNTFVLRSPYHYQGKRFRVATYVKARNCRASMYKVLTGFLTFEEAVFLASDMARGRVKSVR